MTRVDKDILQSSLKIFTSLLKEQDVTLKGELNVAQVKPAPTAGQPQQLMFRE